MTESRNFLRFVGLVGTGAVAGLIARPAMSAANNSLKPDRPINGLTIESSQDIGGSVLAVDLVDNPQLLMLKIIENDSEVVNEDIHLDQLRYWIGTPDRDDRYRVIAYRGNYVDPRTVQSDRITAKS